jgi:hypothetical protein
VVLGVVLIMAGAFLAIAPLSAARAANSLRFVPYSSDPRRVRGYRIAGAAMVVAGVILALVR